jgi:hypothetical protein
MRNSFRFLILAAVFTSFATSAIAAPTPKPVKGQLSVSVRVTNRTKHCAWVTIYFARFYTPWTIAHEPYNRPRFVRDDAFFDFRGILIPDVLPASPGEIKVRAEVMRNADCSGGQIADLSAENKSVFGDQGGGMLRALESELTGDAATGFHLSTPR